jgi:beta-N-acetylhexosaminidase
VILVDPDYAAAMTSDVLAAVQQAQKVVLPVYSVPTAGKFTKNAAGEIVNSVSMSEPSANLMHRILETAAPRSVMIAMGNPYMVSDFPEVQNYLCTFSNATVSEVSAVKALFGEIPINGHLPVEIPGIAKNGFGISRQQVMQGGQK